MRAAFSEPLARPTYSLTIAALEDVVRTTVGEVSAMTALTRSSCDPANGRGSGTAMNPASIEPRNATMYSMPCGARMTARSPVVPCFAISRARFCVRRNSWDQVTSSTLPAQSSS